MKVIYSETYEIEHNLSNPKSYSHSLPTWQKCIAGLYSSEEIAILAAKSDHQYKGKPYRIVRVTQERETVFQSELKS